jgi:alpha-L-fucosidase
MRFGVAFHHEYTWWWYQPAFGSDPTGPQAGKPYDAAHLTLADGKGKWWEGLDPRLLYGIDLRAYKDVANVQYRPEKGIFQDHLEYAHWYATRWALRIMDVINKYNPDFIYTDGDSTGPFSGYKTGTGYKCDCVQRVIADFYNHTLATRGKVDTFAIIKFHPAAKGIVSTVESKYPNDIKRDQDWIGENAAGDWFYKPDVVYSARALELYLLEEVSRDGAYAVNIPISPEGAIDPGAATMLREMGVWMRINGEAIYGSHAWIKFGEGPLDADGKQRLLPMGALNKPQAEYRFTTADFRFTVGEDGALYAFVLEKPKPGEHLKIASLANPAKPITTISLLGSPDKVAFRLAADGLEITTPQHLPEQEVLAFKIR